MLKKYATGLGNASKDQVRDAVKGTYPAFTVETHDEADAVILCALGVHWLGHPLITPSAIQDQALDSVEWPSLLKEAA